MGSWGFPYQLQFFLYLTVAAWLVGEISTGQGSTAFSANQALDTPQPNPLLRHPSAGVPICSHLVCITLTEH